MTKSILLLFLVTTLSSCGKKTTPRGNSFVERSYGEPILLNYSKKDCDRSAAPSSPAQANFYIDGEYKTLDSQKIAPHMFYKVEMGTEFTLVRSRGALLNYKEGEDFQDCDQITEYEAGTFESAARSITTILGLFEQEFSQKLSDIKLKSLKLLVAPIITDVSYTSQDGRRIKRNEKLVDNAFYHQRLDGGLISFLPQGKSTGTQVNRFSSVPLWKIPMVAVHEYGHHIFANLIYRAGQSTASFSDFCVDNSFPIEFAIPRENNTREVNRFLPLGAFNEGFADLVASLLGKEVSTLKNIGCMENSREIFKSIYFDGTTKKLTQDAWDDFFLTTHKKYYGCMSAPSFQNIHTVGAIVAHHIYKSFESLGLSPNDRFTELVEWAKALRRVAIYNFDNPQNILREGIKAYMISLKKRYHVSNLTCNMYFDGFPVLEAREIINICKN